MADETKRFSVERQSGRGWEHVSIETAPFPAQALQQALGGETWKPEESYFEVTLASPATQAGSYRVVELGARVALVGAFSVGVRHVLDVADVTVTPSAVDEEVPF